MTFPDFKMQHRRGPWSQQEDASLLQLVQVHGPHNWVRISQLVGSRSPKQCRERYHQNLKPTLNHEPITPEEGVVIERLVGEMGKRWAEIARRLHGRSDNAVKNWWNGGMNRRRRLGLRPRADAHEECEVVESIEEHEEVPQTPYAVSVPSSPNAFTVNALRPINSSLIPRDDPLTSPSLRSEFSRGQTPSLISDSTSQLSVSSPRLPPSPGNVSSLTLPPLIGHHDSRLHSLTVLPARSAQSLPEFRHPPSSSTFGFSHAERARFSTSAIRGPMESSSTAPYSYLRSKPAPPPSSLFDAQTVRKESRRKDSRMNLANICI